jgi:hypothetical protein
LPDNICNPRWSTKLVRPPSDYTSRLKRKQLREYGDSVHQTRAELVNPSTGKVDTTRCVAHSDNMACYEEDHLIPLEDGGDPTDPRNLWPEAYNTHEGGVVMGASSAKPLAEVTQMSQLGKCLRGQYNNMSSLQPATKSRLRR